MDTLTALLEGPKARGALLLKSIFNPPWSLRVEDHAPVSVVTMVRGSVWVVPDRGEPAPLHPGDVAVMRGPDPYTIADDPDTPTQITVGPEQRCRTRDSADVTETMALGVRTWGDDAEDCSSVMLSGTYRAPSEIGRRLLDAMPPMLVQTAETADNTLVTLLAAEIEKNDPGQELVLDRLLDLLLVNLLRSWLAAPGAPSWYRASGDPVVGQALQLLHRDSAQPWTVASLADRVGVSRATFARRFSALVGESPMAYLASWRLTLAAELLRDPEATVATVARQVGYGSAFAFSAAFKRVRGVSPQEFRSSRRPEAPLGPSSPTLDSLVAR